MHGMRLFLKYPISKEQRCNSEVGEMIKQYIAEVSLEFLVTHQSSATYEYVILGMNKVHMYVAEVYFDDEAVHGRGEPCRVLAWQESV
jgi:hypothetical protein